MPIATYAGIYKCIDENGNTSFQKQACPGSNISSEVAITNSGFNGSAGDDKWLGEAEKIVIERCMRHHRHSADFEKNMKACECSARKILADPALVKSTLDNNDYGAIARLAFKAVSECLDEEK